jgi:hypothetical protein
VKIGTVKTRFNMLLLKIDNKSQSDERVWLAVGRAQKRV